MNSFPRLACDRSGRIWLAYRHRQDGPQTIGGRREPWVEHVTSLAGKAWSVPAALAPERRPARQPPGARRPERRARSWPSTTATAGSTATVEQRRATACSVAALEAPLGVQRGVVGEPPPSSARRPTRSACPKPPPIHPDEAADVARMRGAPHPGRRQDLPPAPRRVPPPHRDLGDGGNDGSLEDMWRYAIDAARLDWIGNGDHDNGGGHEYTWWLTQKTTDLYHDPPGFTPMFTYERSVAYPARPPQRDVRPARHPHAAAPGRTPRRVASAPTTPRCSTTT